MSYHGVADCVLPDGTSMRVTVALSSEPGLLGGLVGTAAAPLFPAAYLNAYEVTLRFPDGQEQKLVVSACQHQTMTLRSTDS
jgi:hypothetical protein